MGLCIPQAEKLPAPQGCRLKAVPLYYSVMTTRQWLTKAPAFIQVPLDGSGCYKCEVHLFIDRGAVQIVVDDMLALCGVVLEYVTEYRSSLAGGKQEKITIDMAGIKLVGPIARVRVLCAPDSRFYVDSIIFQGYDGIQWPWWKRMGRWLKGGENEAGEGYCGSR